LNTLNFFGLSSVSGSDSGVLLVVIVFAGCPDCQSNVELIRQLLTERTILDRERGRFVAVTDINILAAATSPGLPGEEQALTASWLLYASLYCSVELYFIFITHLLRQSSFAHSNQ